MGTNPQSPRRKSVLCAGWIPRLLLRRPPQVRIRPRLHPRCKVSCGGGSRRAGWTPELLVELAGRLLVRLLVLVHVELVVEIDEIVV